MYLLCTSWGASWKSSPHPHSPAPCWAPTPWDRARASPYCNESVPASSGSTAPSPPGVAVEGTCWPVRRIPERCWWGVAVWRRRWAGHSPCGCCLAWVGRGWTVPVWNRWRTGTSSPRTIPKNRFGLSNIIICQSELEMPWEICSYIFIKKIITLTILSCSWANSFNRLISERISPAETPPSPKLLANISASLLFLMRTSSGLSSSEGWSLLNVLLLRSLRAWNSCWALRFSQFGNDLHSKTIYFFIKSTLCMQIPHSEVTEVNMHFWPT